MYFQIENTPERIKKARRSKPIQESYEEKCPRLTLAPFSTPPQIVFENIQIGTSCERYLEVYNPSKQIQQIALGRTLPPGLVVHLPGDWLLLEPETCYCLGMTWTPMQPTAVRETLRFTNENRGRYDVIVILKSVMNIRGKPSQPKAVKISPGKINKKKVAKKSPVCLTKKKAKAVCNTSKVKSSLNIVQSSEIITYKIPDKESRETCREHFLDPYGIQCPFESLSTNDFNFDTSEIFSNLRNNKKGNLENTYDMTYEINASNILQPSLQQNILKPSNRQDLVTSAANIFDKLEFTPLKIPTSETGKLDVNKIIITENSESDFDDSLNCKNSNKENESCPTFLTPLLPNKWLSDNAQEANKVLETPNVINKKIPNTSSPKELNSPNFSINTDFSRISELSFFPHRFSSERKVLPKINNETQLLNDTNPCYRLNSDTYTKELSLNAVMDSHQLSSDQRHHQPFNIRDQYPKMCRQSLFKENQNFRDSYDKNIANFYEHHMHYDFVTAKSPPRSLSPPLQSIPEESGQTSGSHVFDKTDGQMTTFTLNRAFKNDVGKKCSSPLKQTWSKRAIRAEPELWKVATPLLKKIVKKKVSKTVGNNKNKDKVASTVTNLTFERKKPINQNTSFNHIGNVYSQSFTTDPFLSTTYYYDEEAVDKFEGEFKRWLNYILTPPSDLDSNVEQKIDVGKAWIENRNKDVPAAPTKEQVSSIYHNSHRLESLRRSARALLLSPEITQVTMKLNVQIEKKLIAIRNDRNLHLDIGLQRTITELLLSYNPLWLRIGLEVIYGLVLPLRSNSDIEGLTIFIVQRMFKNPYLKNKHSKSSAPNILLPAYTEAIKKFTLKKFFLLVFFLDQAKQKKIISHDPCLFCRNAVCKESREIVIRFTRELIAGIGDITRHLRPLGYVVCHKQSYLDEYKYAVHNIAVDIRDGVRLTKVMEIILMKNGLLSQLRTPPISRLQKIHNVQVAFNALKDANFIIEGDITAADIADGHREKTLSLLWQLIHVFRAPLFVKAANIVQTWWRKKYAVIVQERRKEEEVREKLNYAASTIQVWWRRIQYNRMIELKMQELTYATIVIQKYFRKWFYRRRFLKMKMMVETIEQWYYGVKRVREAREILQTLRLQREEKLYSAAIKIQACARRWICRKRYQTILQKVILIQSIVRCFIKRKYFLRLKQSVSYVQEKYQGKLMMREQMKQLALKIKSVIIIQSYYRMVRQRRLFHAHKKAVKSVEDRYRALLKMREARNSYLMLKGATVKIQTIYKSKKCRKEFLRCRNSIIKVQQKVRAKQQMVKERNIYLTIRTAILTIQKHMRGYLAMKKEKNNYHMQRKAAITIQKHFRAYRLGKAERIKYLQLRTSVINVQNRYRSLLKMRRERKEFIKIRYAAIVIQRRYRALILMRTCKTVYENLHKAAIIVQRRYRAKIQMLEERSKYLRLKTACIVIQNIYKACIEGKRERHAYIQQKESAVKIQRWFRSCIKTKEVKQQYQMKKLACITIQRHYKAYIMCKIVRHEFIRIKTATIYIQKYYRNYLLTKRIRQEYIALKTATVKIQRFYRSYTETCKQKENYTRLKSAALKIQNYYRNYKETQRVQLIYTELRAVTINIQRKFRALRAMKIQRQQYLILKHSVIIIQQQYRALTAMRSQRQFYLKLQNAVTTVQQRFRAQISMKKERAKYLNITESCKKIQRFYRAYRIGKKHRSIYLNLKNATLLIQRKYRAMITMRKFRTEYLLLRSSTVLIQNKFRAHKLMLNERKTYCKILNAVVTLQRYYRSYKLSKNIRQKFLDMKSAAVVIQNHYRNVLETRKIRRHYLQFINTVKYVQRHIKRRNYFRKIRREEAARKIQIWYRSIKLRNKCRDYYLDIKRKVVITQSVTRMHIKRKQYMELKRATITIQQTYKTYKLAAKQRQHFIHTRSCVIKVQACVRSYIHRKRFLSIRSAVLVLQALYRLKRHKALMQQKRQAAVECIQKNVRCYLMSKWYNNYKNHVIFIQRLWKGKLLTRLIRREFLLKRQIIIKIQAIAKGYLVRKQIQSKKEVLKKLKEEHRLNCAASKIQALFRGNSVRVKMEKDSTVGELRRRWIRGALQSTEKSLRERNDEALEILHRMADIETLIRTFRSLELLTEVFPMMYEKNASSVVGRVYIYMSLMNRSISSIEVLKSAASLLVNLARYKVTGQQIYKRERIPPVLKFMWRFSNSEPQLFCIFSTYLWLFSKYNNIKEDITELLHNPENHKILVTIKNNVDRMKKMENVTKHRFQTPQPSKTRSRISNHSIRDSMNYSLCSTSNIANLNHFQLPSLEPDYGIIRAEQPRYFEDAQQAITCLFITYKI